MPVRHGRMMVSPFTFYRGAAKVMAADLAGTPTAGLDVQLCGDAHLSNFGGFASPERQLLFGLNDFDETLPGPFEYDLKRMAASFTIAARNNGFTAADAHAVTVESVKAYREAMGEFAAMRTLDVWYAHMSEQRHPGRRCRPSEGQATVTPFEDREGQGRQEARVQGPATIGQPRSRSRSRRPTRLLRKAHTRDSLQALSRFAEVVDGRYRIVSQPPVVVPLRELDGAWGLSTDQIRDVVEDQFRAYQTTLSADRRLLLERFTDRRHGPQGGRGRQRRHPRVHGAAQGRDNDDPLFLQVKEATRSVLEDHLPKSRFHTPGQRVVEGQRLMQAPRTSSSAGPRACRTTASTTGASCAT